MLIRYCANCAGNPYTTDPQATKCPICGTPLQIASVASTELEQRDELPIGFGDDGVNGADDFADDYGYGSVTENDNVYVPKDTVVDIYDAVDDIDVPVYMQEPPIASRRNGVVRITGKVTQYNKHDTSDGYRRLLPVKLFQVFAYSQRLEDCLHSFTVTTAEGESIVVNVHGTTNCGASIVDNETVEVVGRFTHDNILMAQSVNVLNGRQTTPVTFQRAVGVIVTMWLLAILAVVCVLGFSGFGSNSVKETFNNILTFGKTVVAVYVVLLILYVIALFSRIGLILMLLGGGRRGGSPLGVMLVLAFVISLLLCNTFGIGGALAGSIGAVLPIVLIIGAIIWLVKVFFRG